jgi:hypothetical protein
MASDVIRLHLAVLFKVELHFMGGVSTSFVSGVKHHASTSRQHNFSVVILPIFVFTKKTVRAHGEFYQYSTPGAETHWLAHFFWTTMAPLRATNSPQASTPSSEDSAIIRQGDSALASAKRNFSYLINPSKTTDHPQRFRTRALLRTLNYVTKFIFWRIVRYAKYVAIGSLVAAVGATAFGGMISGVA